MSRVGLFGQISEINDHLFLSGAGVLKPDKLRQKKITCIVNATTEEPNAYFPGIDYMKIRIEDNPHARLDNYFDMVADKIRSVKERGGKTLVHCVAGVSRSASLCIVYLVKYEKMTLRQAYHYVKAARPIVRPNVGFWKQMIDYEKRLRGHASVSMVNTIHCDLPIPDVYSNDLKKYLLNRLEAETSRRKSEVEYGPKKRDFSLSSLMRPTLQTSVPRSTLYNHSRGMSSAAPSGTSIFSSSAHPIHIYNRPGKLFFSPAPSRRPRDSSSIFGNF